MILYGKQFDIDDKAVEMKSVNYITCEGTIIPLNIEMIKGLGDHLFQCGFSDKKRIINSVYLFLSESIEECTLCIKYANGKIRVVPKAGCQIGIKEIEILCNMLTNKYKVS